MNELTKPEQELQPAPTQAVTPAEMLAIAVQQGADLEKLEKLMDLQERYEAAEAKKAFVAAVAEFRNNCPIIERTKEGHNSKYAGLAETIEQIKDIMAANGLSHSWRTEQKDGLITVTCCVQHIAGHSECTSLSSAKDDTGGKNSIQAIASAVSYLERYTFYAILGLASSDMDDDGKKAAPQKTEFTPYQYQRLISTIEGGNGFDFFCYQKELGEKVFESIHNTFPDGKKTALKTQCKKLEQEGRAMIKEVEEIIIKSIKEQDAGRLAETVEELGVVGKMLVWADMSRENRKAAKDLMETLK